MAKGLSDEYLAVALIAYRQDGGETCKPDASACARMSALVFSDSAAHLLIPAASTTHRHFRSQLYRAAVRAFLHSLNPHAA